MVYGKDLNQRTERIRHILSGHVTHLTKHNLKVEETEHHDFNVYQVEIDFLKYRVTNTRTVFDQFVEIQKNNRDPKFFEDPESELVQQVQHEILKEASKDKNLYKKFEKGEKQGAPLIISNDGFVIAGNRRLAAFRDLYEKDYQKYSHFKNIKIVIWPFTADSDESRNFESLQEVEKDIKSEFSWISVAMSFQKILDEEENGYEKIIKRYKNSRFISYRVNSKRKEEINNK